MVLTDLEKQERHHKLKAIRDLLLIDKNSPFFKYRTENNYFQVIGEGNAEAKILLVGEAPGATEAKKGHPFCGASGKFLDVMLASIRLERKDVYITNLVKDRPPENRDPLPEEIAYYSPLLLQQIDIIQPECIVTLGRFSMMFLLNHFGLADKLDVISKIHGQEFSIPNSGVKIITLYHPAVALYNGGMREKLIADFSLLKKFITSKE